MSKKSSFAKITRCAVRLILWEGGIRGLRGLPVEVVQTEGPSVFGILIATGPRGVQVKTDTAIVRIPVFDVTTVRRTHRDNQVDRDDRDDPAAGPGHLTGEAVPA